MKSVKSTKSTKPRINFDPKVKNETPKTNETKSNKKSDTDFDMNWFNEKMKDIKNVTFWKDIFDDSELLTLPQLLLPCEDIILQLKYSHRIWESKGVYSEWYYINIKDEDEDLRIPIYGKIFGMKTSPSKRGRKKKTEKDPKQIIIEIYNLIVKFFENGMSKDDLVQILIERFNKKYNYIDQPKDEIINELCDLLQLKHGSEIPLTEKQIHDISYEIHSFNQTLEETDRRSIDEIESFVINSHNLPYENLKSKQLILHIEQTMKKFLDNKIYTRGVTCNVSPEHLMKDGIYTEDLAWIKIRQRINNVIERIKSIKEIIFVLLTIEVHPGEKRKHKRIKKFQSLTSAGTPFPITRLEGFPHIHCVIGLCKYNGYNLISQSEIFSIFQGDFDDIDVDRSSKGIISPDGSDPAKTIKYVIKNSRHLSSFEKLYGYYPLSLYDFTSDNKVKNYFEIYQQYKIRYNYYSVQKSSNSDLTQKQISYNTALDKCFSYLQGYMESNGHFLYREEIYQLVKGSRKTYEQVKNKKGQIMSLESYYVNIIPSEQEIGLMMNSKNKIIDFLQKTENYVPTIQISYDWIEFKDFYVFYNHDKIEYHKTCKVEACCKFINYSWEERLRRDLPILWYSIIENQHFQEEIEKNLLHGLYKILLYKIEKEPSLYLIGESNSGKTTLLECTLQLLPENCILYFSKKCGDFIFTALADADEDSKIVVNCDEGGALSDFGKKELLDLLSGKFNDTVNLKNKKPIKVEKMINVVIATNKDSLNFFDQRNQRHIDFIRSYNYFEISYEATEKGDTSIEEYQRGKILFETLQNEFAEQKAIDKRLLKIRFSKPIREINTRAKDIIKRTELPKIFFYLVDKFYSRENNIMELID